MRVTQWELRCESPTQGGEMLSHELSSGEEVGARLTLAPTGNKGLGSRVYPVVQRGGGMGWLGGWVSKTQLPLFAASWTSGILV